MCFCVVLLCLMFVRKYSVLVCVVWLCCVVMCSVVVLNKNGEAVCVWIIDVGWQLWWAVTCG